MQAALREVEARVAAKLSAKAQFDEARALYEVARKANIAAQQAYDKAVREIWITAIEEKTGANTTNKIRKFLAQK